MSLQLNGDTGVTFNDASLQGAAASPNVLKNRIINGAMVINQRGFSGTPTDGAYTLDRWYADMGVASKFTVSQNAGSVTPPAGFVNYLGVTSSSAYSISATDIFTITQKIEGYNISDLAWGTASAKTVTLSFLVYSSLTGTFGGTLRNNGNSRCYPFTYSIPTANTWTQISVTIAGDTSGTWLTTNGNGLVVAFGLGVGSTYSGTAGAWSSNLYFSATGATSVVGTNGATFYITGVQLEQNTSATPFERRMYGQELANCQRYFNLIDSALGVSTGTTTLQLVVNFPVQMRAAPSVAGTTLRVTDMYVADFTSSNPSPSTANATIYGARINSSNFTGMTTGRATALIGTGASAAPLQFSAEL
jgi:hypothetical protein